MDTLTKNTGVILEGGGFRAIFVAGVLEAFLQHHLSFPYMIGVSAGTAYGVSYVTGQQERNRQINRYINDPRYCGIRHLMKNGNYFNWDFIYKQIPQKLESLEYERLPSSPTRFYTVVTNCVTARPEYFNLNESSPDRLCDFLTATSSLPFISKMKIIDGKPYLDGGLADAIPIHHALQQGYEKLVVILTRPKGYRKEDSSLNTLFGIRYRQYPSLVKLMRERASLYNQRIEEIEKLEKEGKAYIIRPTETIPIKRLENNPEISNTVFTDTVRKMESTIPELVKWLRQ